MDDLNIGFLGFGLIGGSIARAIKAAYPGTVIQVYSRRKNPDLEKGQRDGIITHLLYEIDEHFSSCNLIFLCAPVLKNIEFLHLLKPLIRDTCILTDVGSVKGNIHTAIKELDMEEHFIGGHPMAGSEKTGYANSSAELLKNSCYLLTPTESVSEHDQRLLRELLQCTGAKCILLSSNEHDDITAAVSHVPHIIAASLVHLVQDNDTPEEYMKQFAAGGFKDITRIASSSPEMWENICLANKESIDLFLSYYMENLAHFRRLLTEEDSAGLRDFFEKARKYRDSIL